MELHFGMLTEADAREVLLWRYDPPYDIYNVDPAHLQDGIAALLDPANRYFVATDAGGRIAGYCCFGPDARVPGGDYLGSDALDVGLGLRPDLTGQGRGAAFVRAVLLFGRERLGARRYRLAVAAFNRRAIRLYERAGFREVERFRRGGRPDDLEFVLMLEGA
jgi:RimJ/RimL family protein N-acetyltransferase